MLKATKAVEGFIVLEGPEGTIYIATSSIAWLICRHGVTRMWVIGEDEPFEMQNPCETVVDLVSQANKGKGVVK